MKFGSAWPGENKDNEIVSIPGLRGRDPKEITLKNLSKIINARVVEIIEQVFVEIKNYGHDDPRKKLIAGIVLTGGGSQLKHIKQLVEYITGMDTRIGYPNEHLAGDSNEEITSPVYATAVGLLMHAIQKDRRNRPEPQPTSDPSSGHDQFTAASEADHTPTESQGDTTTAEASADAQATGKPEKKERKSTFDSWIERFITFLNDAE